MNHNLNKSTSTIYTNPRNHDSNNSRQVVDVQIIVDHVLINYPCKISLLLYKKDYIYIVQLSPKVCEKILSSTQFFYRLCFSLDRSTSTSTKNLIILSLRSNFRPNVISTRVSSTSHISYLYKQTVHLLFSLINSLSDFNKNINKSNYKNNIRNVIYRDHVASL